MVVVKLVDEEIANKVDTGYVRQHLPEIQGVAIVFMCTSEGGEEDEWIDEETGIRQIVIHLPYKVVKRSKDIRPLMLELAKERLGLVPGGSMN